MQEYKMMNEENCRFVLCRSSFLLQKQFHSGSLLVDAVIKMLVMCLVGTPRNLSLPMPTHQHILQLSILKPDSHPQAVKIWGFSIATVVCCSKLVQTTAVTLRRSEEWLEIALLPLGTAPRLRVLIEWVQINPEQTRWTQVVSVVYSSCNCTVCKGAHAYKAGFLQKKLCLKAFLSVVTAILPRFH